MRLSSILVASAFAACAALQGCADSSHAADPAKPAAKTVAVPVVHVDDLPDEAEIAALFDKWNVTLRTGSPHDMANLYAEDGILLPTVSNQVRSNRSEIAEYFVHFQALKPRGTINEQYIEVLDRNTAVSSGVYTFDIVREGRADYVVARYSYIYEKVGNDWLIVSHHSSAMPQQVDERPLALSAIIGKPASADAHDDDHKDDHAAAPSKKAEHGPDHASDHASDHGAAKDSHAAH
jgi:uncharacterized protein (TIGR02246 family)